MRYIFSILLCLILQSGFSQIIKTVGISYTNGTPTYTPAKAGSWLALDTTTWRYYTWNGTSWLSDGFRVQTISGCSAPAYTPTKYQSLVVINACNDAQGGPEIYKWSGSVWEKSGGTAYTAGTGIAISGSNEISNTAPDQTVTMTDGTGIDVTGTYPNFTVTNTLPNVVQTLSIAGQDLTLSNGGGTVAIPGGGADTLARTVHTDQYTPNTAWRFANDIGTKQNKKILLLGDSWFDNGNYLQYYLYERFNSDDYVVGGTFTVSSQNNTGVKVPAYTGTWSVVSFSTSYPQTYTGYDGYAASSSSAGAICSFETQITAAAIDVEKFTTAKIFALNNGAEYRIRTDGGGWTTVTTTSGNTINTYVVSGLSLAAHKIDIEVVSGTVTLYGGVFSNATKGCSVLKSGNSGSRTREWKDLVRSANWKSQISAVDPDLIFVHLGLNDNASGASVATYTANMDTIVSALQSYFSDSVTIVIVAPVEPISSYRILPSIQFRNAASQVSVNKQTGFISFFDLYNKSYTWGVQNSLFTQPDGIHPAQLGGMYLANEINLLLKSGTNYVPADGLAGAIQFSDGKLLDSRDSLRVTTLPLGVNIGTGSNAAQGYRLTLRGDAAGIGNLKALNSSGQTATTIGSDGALTITSNPGAQIGLTLQSLITGNTGSFLLRPRSSALGSPADFEMVLNGRLYTNAYEFILTGGGGINITGRGVFSGSVSAAEYLNTASHYYFTSSNSVEKWLSNSSSTTAKAGIVFKPTGAWFRQDIGLGANNVADLSALSSSNVNLWARSAGHVEIVNDLKVGGSTAPVASARLEVVSTTKGFLPPRMTTAQRDAIASPATGLTLYCTDCTATDASSGVMQTYNGATWKNNW